MTSSDFGTRSGTIGNPQATMSSCANLKALQNLPQASPVVSVSGWNAPKIDVVAGL